MPAKNSTLSQSSERELVITRIFNAPPALLFKMWTEQEHLEHWQGAPKGFTVPFHESDIRPGGSFKICMRSPEGIDHWLGGVYREVTPPERLVFTHSWLNAEGKPGKETLVTITLKPVGDKTELTLRQTGFTSDEARNGHQGGWNSSFDRLHEYVDQQAK
jgi:uncharacterized protein YndB with AHSA1/START domain